MSQLWTTWRRRRHLGVALMTCALLLGAYLLWTSTSGHVVGHRLNDYRQSRIDQRSSRAFRYKILHNAGVLSEPKFAASGEDETISGQLQHLVKQASNQTVPLLGSSAWDVRKRTSISDNSVEPKSITFSRPTQQVRPITQKHNERNIITRREYIDQIPPATANYSNFFRRKNRRRWKLTDPDTAQTGLLSDKYPNKVESRPHTSAISASISQSKKDVVTPTPIQLCLVVPSDDNSESVEVFLSLIHISEPTRPY